MCFLKSIVLKGLTCFHIFHAPQRACEMCWIHISHGSNPLHLWNGKWKREVCLHHLTSGAAFLLHLHGDVANKAGMALQTFINAATRASLKWDTRGQVDDAHISRDLLLHVHQLLHRLALALPPCIDQRHHCRRDEPLTVNKRCRSGEVCDHQPDLWEDSPLEE